MLCLQWTRVLHVDLSCSSCCRSKQQKGNFPAPIHAGIKGPCWKNAAPSRNQAEATLEGVEGERMEHREGGTLRREAPKGAGRSPQEKSPGPCWHPAPRSQDPTQQKQLPGPLGLGKAGQARLALERAQLMP